MMFGGMGWGAGTVLGPIFMILVWIFVIAAITWLVLTLTRQGASAASALGILEQRFARGEIDLDEFKARRSAIGGAR